MLPLAVVASLVAPLCAFGQTGYTITGGLSNFDCTNRCDDPCDGFEVEIENCRPEDVYHTYRNGNYGSPAVVAVGSNTRIIYQHPQHPTPVGTIEHFGVGLANFNPLMPIRVRWLRNGQPATVNGQIPLPGGGSAPTTQPMLPSIDTQLVTNPEGGNAISLSVTNNDPNQSIWIKRKVVITAGQVLLEDLMRNDPVVTGAFDLDASPILVFPGVTVTVVSDLFEFEDNQSAVFSALYYQDLFGGGPFGAFHMPGPELGNVMTASITAPQGPCEEYAPVVTTQPVGAVVQPDRHYNLRVDVSSDDIALTYEWRKDGVTIVDGGSFSGQGTDELSIDPMNDSTEGIYSVRISNTCGTVTSDAVSVLLPGHRVAPPVVCALDYNRDSVLNLDDLGDFITDFYTDPPVPAGAQAFAPLYAGTVVGFGVPCPAAPDAPAPYSVDAYRQFGYRVGYSPDGTNACPLAPNQTFPNLDNLGDYITAYYAAVATGC
jgi:hypothetical protein